MYNSSSGAEAPKLLFCVTALCELQSAVFIVEKSVVMV